MIKKIIILAVVVGVGYIGYVVWNNLTVGEKAVVTQKIDDTQSYVQKFAKKTVDSLTTKARDAIEHIDNGQKKVIH